MVIKVKKILLCLILGLILIIPIKEVSAFNISDYVQVLDGCEVVGNELNTWMKNAFKFVQFVGIALAVILTALDFIQVIGGSKDDDLKNAFGRSIKRLIAVILLLLTTVLVGFVIDIVNPVIDDANIPNCVEGI